MGRYVWPCPKYSRISSGYGNRNCPFHGAEFHDGIDIAASKGTQILAFDSGVVIKSGRNGAYGNYISIEHGGGLMSFYGHCLELYVKKGQTVNAGQKIASVGNTGSSTGYHLHFGIHLNGKKVNPLNYVKDTDTVSRYNGKKESNVKNSVKAKFTAYYPANNAMEGGFYDAQGNLLNPSNKTCAAPPNIPFGTKITIQDTGTSLDGSTYKVTDRGGAIKIKNGVYHFDLLMSSNSECNRWGIKYGTAIINDENSANSGLKSQAVKEKSKDISKVSVKSITGAVGTRKEILRDIPTYLKTGVQIIIQNNQDKFQIPAIEGKITWETKRFGSPASLKFTVVKDNDLNFHEGNPVSFKFNDKNVFYGYVFSKSRKNNKFIDVVCYDQTRYFKNKDTVSYEDKSYSDLLKMLAKDYNLVCGNITDTKYKIKNRIDDGTIFDILGYACDLTVINTNKMFVLYDDFGKLTLKPYEEMILPIWIDEDTAQNFNYTSSIDSETYNCIKFAYDNDKTGEREIYVFNDEKNQSKWGILQYYSKIDNASSSADLQVKAEALMKYYNVIKRELTFKKVFGDVRVRAGSSIAVGIGLGDINIKNYMCVENAVHTFDYGFHTMDLKLSGIRGEFRV